MTPPPAPDPIWSRGGDGGGGERASKNNSTTELSENLEAVFCDSITVSNVPGLHHPPPLQPHTQGQEGPEFD